MRDKWSLKKYSTRTVGMCDCFWKGIIEYDEEREKSVQATHIVWFAFFVCE